jgi:gas vesicle protein
MELFKLLGTIAVDNTKANTALDETTEKAKDSGKETESAFSKIGGAAKKIATGIGAAGVAIGGAFIGAVEGTREYRIEMGKLDTAFVTNGHSSESAKKTYSELNAVLGDSGQAVEASNHLALLTDNEKDLQTWTDICTGVYATFGDSLPIEGLTEAANETAKVGQVTGPLADALNWAGISEDEFNEKLSACTSEQERQKLIMETLNNTYDNASEQYKKTNKDIIESEKANERLKDALAKVGEVGEPVMTAIKNAIASMAEKSVPVITDLITKFRDFTKWISENESKVKLWIGVLLIATSTAAGFVLVLTWSTIMKKAASAVKVVTVAIKALNVAMRANIIGLVVTAIIGLVAAFIYLWKNCEGFRKFWMNLWKAIQKAASSAYKGIQKAFSGIGSWFKNKFNEVQKAGKDAMTSVKKWFSDAKKSITNTFSNIGSWFGSKFRSAFSSIKSAFSGWGSFFSGLWGKVKSKFGSIGTSIGTSMGNAVKNGMNGALSKVESAINKGIGLINSAIKLANKLPGINVGTVGKLSLPRLEKGAVLEKGQVGILEGTGAEAVVPLENNRKWLSKVAADLHAYQSNDYTDILTRLNRLIELLEGIEGMQVCLDSGALVGELTEPINKKLGIIYNKNNRGNTR